MQQCKIRKETKHIKRLSQNYVKKKKIYNHPEDSTLKKEIEALQH